MLMPILLDAFLWLGPHLSAYSLFRALSSAMPPVETVQQLLEQVDPFVRSINLFSWLSPTLLGVPSLMAGTLADKIPTGTPTTWAISSELVYFALFFLLGLFGLILSAIYWEMLASRACEQALSLGHVPALWWGLVKIAFLLTLVVAVIGLPTLMAALLALLFGPLAAQFVVMMGGSIVLWVLFYLAFAIHGVALRGVRVFQSVRMSLMLMQTQFLSTMGLIVICMGIYVGMGFVWNLVPSDSWVRAAGILGHAFTATGLLTATALFYLDRTKTVNSEQPAVAGGQ
jgi:hypothetical protein